jgi:hypothetical protein
MGKRNRTQSDDNNRSKKKKKVIVGYDEVITLAKKNVTDPTHGKFLTELLNRIKLNNNKCLSFKGSHNETINDIFDENRNIQNINIDFANKTFANIIDCVNTNFLLLRIIGNTLNEMGHDLSFSF